MLAVQNDWSGEAELFGAALEKRYALERNPGGAIPGFVGIAHLAYTLQYLLHYGGCGSAYEAFPAHFD